MIYINSKKMSDEQIKMGSMMLHRGHRLFRYNTKTTELSVCTSYEIDDNGNKKVVVEQDCIYIMALNERNAIRKLKNLSK
jgi:hypothetical protein